MATEPGPNIRRRQLGLQLRRLREAVRMTADEAATASGISRPTISRIENGKQTILPKNVRLLCQVYDVGAPMIDMLVRLAEDSDERGWWLAYSDTVPDWFEQYVGLESEASEIWNYEAEYVPGLLQTAEYVRAISAVSRPDSTEQDLARSVDLRQARQHRLNGASPPKLIAVINEAVIHRVVGSPAVMYVQLRHLLEMSQRPNITLQVMSFAGGGHPGMTGPFIMLRFPDDDEMTTVYLENDRGSIYPPRPADIARYTWIFRRVRELALSPNKTKELLSTVMERYRPRAEGRGTG